MRKKTTEEFIEKAKSIYGDRFSYEKSIYLGTQKPIIVTCPIHGDFTVLPNNFYLGHNCQKCGKTNVILKQVSNTDEFIKKARKIHGDKYDYSKVDYINSKTEVIIICPIHGEFLQTPNSHLDGRGCQKCGILTTKNKRKLSLDKFIEKARIVHGDKYDYSKVEYVNNATKIEIICPTHGTFYQVPKDHIRGCGCSKCSHERTGLKVRKSLEQFIQDARKVHGDKYNYNEVEYINANTKICIVCPKHGEFWLKPNSHLSGSGCPKCKESRGEETIRLFLENKNINFIPQYIVENFKIDFYIPEFNIYIEYNGIQHYISQEHFGGKEKFMKQIERDKKLREYCNINNINLIEIPYTCKKDTLIEILSNLNNMKVISKLLLTIETDIETGEISLLNREIINDDLKNNSNKKKTKTKTNDNPDPIVTLDTNKLILTQGAVDLLQVCDDCRIDIKYNKDGKPIIGTDKAFGTKGGNLLTQKLTVSYRGSANTKLATFGDTFKLEPTKDEGIYLMVGNKEPHTVEIPEEIIDIENELDMTNLDELDANLDSKELSDFDFTF